MPVTQAQFRTALLNADAPVPAGLDDGGGAPAGARYDVYRNNVTASLVDAMKLAFPTVRLLLGAQNFDPLMPHFVRAHPPRSPLMMQYGVEFPAFLENFQPLAHLGYLADIARIDLAMRTSYHAADARPLDPSIFQQPPETLENMRLRLAPATQILRSHWPIFDLWRRATDPTAPKPRTAAQAVLITRPAFDPALHLLPEGAATFLLSVRDQPLGASVEAAQVAAPGFDFGATLALLLENHAFAHSTEDSSK